MGKSRASPKMVLARQRERRAFDLRARGLRYHEIGRELGVTESAAQRAVMRGLERTAEETENADQLRSIECERLDAIQRAVWPAAMEGQLGAVDRVIRISERRSRLLGLDLRPPDVVVSGPEVIIIDARMPHERTPPPTEEYVVPDDSGGQSALGAGEGSPAPPDPEQTP